MAWTDLTTMRKSIDDIYRSADVNEILDNLELLAHPPAVTVEKTVHQSIPSSSSPTVIEWDGVAWHEDRWGTMWDSGSRTKIIAPIAGLYVAIGSVHFAAQSGSGVTRRGAGMRVGGSTNRVEVELTGGRWERSVSWARRIATPGTDLDFTVEQQSGDVLNLEDTRTLMTVYWAGFATLGWDDGS